MAHKLKSRGSLGLDVGTSAVKLVEVAKAGLSYRVEGCAVEPLPSGAAGAVAADIEAVGLAVRRAYRRSGSRLKKVAMAVDAANAIIRILPLPVGLTPREQEEQIEVLAARDIPYPIEDVAWDFEILGASTRSPDSEDALLVAVRRDHIAHRQAIAEAAGLHARSVDCEALALANAWEFAHGRLADGDHMRVTLFADFGAGGAHLSFFRDGRIVYTREQAFGAQRLAEECLRRCSLPCEDAVWSLCREEWPPERREELVGPLAYDMALQLNHALQFFTATVAEHAEIDRVVLCGACAAIPGIAGHIAAQTGRTVETANPFDGLALGPGVRAQEIERAAPLFMVACGLALGSRAQ